MAMGADRRWTTWREHLCHKQQAGKLDFTSPSDVERLRREKVATAYLKKVSAPHSELFTPQ